MKILKNQNNQKVEMIMSEEATAVAEPEIVEPSFQVTDLIQHALDQDYNKANKVFGSLMGVKINDTLDQEKIKLADQIFNGVEDEEDDEDNTQGELDLEAEGESESEESGDEEEDEDKDEDEDVADEEEGDVYADDIEDEVHEQ